MMAATRELTEENEKMRTKDRDLALSVELHEKEKTMAIKRSEAQKRVNLFAGGMGMLMTFIFAFVKTISLITS